MGLHLPVQKRVHHRWEDRLGAQVGQKWDSGRRESFSSVEDFGHSSLRGPRSRDDGQMYQGTREIVMG